MCYIKTVYKPLEFSKPLFPSNLEEEVLDHSSTEIDYQPTQDLKCQKQNAKDSSNIAYQSLLFNLMQLHLSRNSQSLGYIHKKIQECEQCFDSIINQWKESETEELQESKSQKEPLSEVFLVDDVTPLKQQFSENILTNKLFGQKKYKFKLTLQSSFQDVIYKERNIKVSLSLKNLNGKTIKNSNIINLCFALADDNGNWINLNRVGDPMLKGKTEVELYHGQAEFNKIYTKDISRTFPNGKVNIVIYAKPSMLIYDGLTSEYEEHIEELSVEPLIISDIVIKAKKKY